MFLRESDVDVNISDYVVILFFSTGAVYISTEDVFPSKRLHQLTQSFAKGDASLTDNIFIEHAADVVSKSEPRLTFQISCSY